MQPLSKQAEAKLISAIERAASYVNGGLAPNAAIIKSASESDIPSGHINLMVHAYNTGRTTKQREQGNDTLEKAADFPLADAATVMDSLFPKAVKTSAEISRAHVISAEYAIDPAGMLARRQAAQTKAAAAKISLPEKTWTPPPRDEEAAARRAASEKRAAELAQEELRRQATAAYTKAAAAMEELHEYFRHPGNMSFQDAVRETELRFGEDGVSVLNKLAAVYPHLTKQAATRDLVIGECQPCKLAAAVLTALEAYNEAQAQVPAAKQAASKKAEPAVITGSILYNPADEPLELKSAAQYDEFGKGVTTGPVKPLRDYESFEGGPPADARREADIGSWNAQPDDKLRAQSALADYLEQQMAEEEAAAAEPPAPPTPPSPPKRPPASSPAPTPRPKPTARGGKSESGFSLAPARSGFLGAAKAIAARMAQGAAEGEKRMKNKAYQSLTDPEHESALRNIRAQSMLHDLVLNDPVISGHDPNEVAQAFNELADVAPQFVDSPAAMQALLRKRLEAGQMADFDVKQLVDMEKARAETGKAQMETKKLEQQLI